MNINSAFAKAVITSLIRWKGKTEEEAKQYVLENPLEKVEAEHKGSKTSVESGFNGLILAFEQRGLTFSEEQKKKLWEEVLAGNGEELENLQKQLAYLDINPGELAVQVGSMIHDKWVEDFPSKFNQYEPKLDKDGVQQYDDEGKPLMNDRTKKTYMHNPTELLGFVDFYSDYVFLQPVMEAMGCAPADSREVFQSYLKAQYKYLQDIDSMEKLKELIMSSDYYKALDNYPAGKKALFQKEKFVDRMIEQMNKDGILELIIKGKKDFREEYDDPDNNSGDGAVDFEKIKGILDKNKNQDI